MTTPIYIDTHVTVIAGLEWHMMYCSDLDRLNAMALTIGINQNVFNDNLTDIRGALCVAISHDEADRAVRLGAIVKNFKNYHAPKN